MHLRAIFKMIKVAKTIMFLGGRNDHLRGSVAARRGDNKNRAENFGYPKMRKFASRGVSGNRPGWGETGREAAGRSTRRIFGRRSMGDLRTRILPYIDIIISLSFGVKAAGVFMRRRGGRAVSGLAGASPESQISGSPPFVSRRVTPRRLPKSDTEIVFYHA
jgi:hypothetical protein